ncbi:Solute carrier family 13 member 2 [Lamellibrachia satsuma]|nr:Solute carrier family 13 member 2 [Lamellibrachia satsuma]
MAVLWVTEALPLAITSLLPIFLLPLFGILSTMKTAQAFVSGPTMLFIGANVIALAIERTNLHRRLAFRILLTLGVKPKRLMLGFMLTSWFVSMWMCNTATTSMLLPILESVLRQIEESGDENNSSGMSDHCSKSLSQFEEPHKACCADGAKSINFHKTEGTCSPPGLKRMQEKEAREPVIVVDAAQSTAVDGSESGQAPVSQGFARRDPEGFRKLAVGLTLSICFAANVGGVATINGAIPNMIMKGHADKLWVENTGEKFSRQLHFVGGVWRPRRCHQPRLPLALDEHLLPRPQVQNVQEDEVVEEDQAVETYLRREHSKLGPIRSTFGCFLTKVQNVQEDQVVEEDQAVETYLRREHSKLGPISVDQILVTVLLVTLVTLWVFREPGFMAGWAHYFPKGYMVDATPAVLIGLLLFVIPTNFTGSSGKGGTVPTLMDWETMQRRFPWAVVMLMGGGFTLAKACAVSGLSKWIGKHIVFDDLPRWFMLLVILILVALLTEVTSNPATCSLLMPIVAPLAINMGLNPLYLMLPVCFATSFFAFMLPAAAPPNAIVFCYGRLKTTDMITAGAILNVICVATVVLATETWGMPLFDLATVPWNTTAPGNATGMGMINVATVIGSLEWKTLERRQVDAKLVVLYRVKNNLVGEITKSLTAAPEAVLLPDLHPRRRILVLSDCGKNAHNISRHGLCWKKNAVQRCPIEGYHSHRTL